MKKLLFTFSFLLFALFLFSQTIQILTSKPKISLRGLSVVNNDIIWASGSNGTIARSTDGGKTFDWQTVKDYEQRDFRDIEAFDANTAIILAIDTPAIILKTKDGGKTWKKAFEDKTPGMFLDAMDFKGKNGVVIGDPINGNMFIAFTRNNGDRWKLPKEKTLLAKGEAFFASSGTNVKLLYDSFENRFDYIVISGGTESNFITDKKYKLDVLQGKESQGANSITVDISAKKLVVVGGDFANDKDTTGNCVLSQDFGNTWQKPQTSPHGYRSCVEFMAQNKLITCGTSGVDISNDGGMNWTLISNESFHVCQKAKNGNAVFLAGKDGRIAELKE